VTGGRRPLFPDMSIPRWSIIGVLVLGLCLFPLFESNQYVLTVFVTTMILAILNVSWNFVLGVAGVWNFGQLAIYALGGYGAGILMLHTPIPAAIDIVLGGLMAAGISILMAVPTLRLFGIYTSLLTFAFAEVVQYVIENTSSGLTGGTFGFPSVQGLYGSLTPVSSTHAYYWTALGVIVVSTVGVALVSRSRLGIGLRAIRDAPAFAAARGVSPLRYRMLAFALSGFLAGIAGGLYLSFNQSIAPTVMGLTAMSIDVTMLVIGGLGTLLGPIIGTTIVAIVETLLVNYPGIEFTVVGAVLLVIVVFVPGGVVGFAGRLRSLIAGGPGGGEPLVSLPHLSVGSSRDPTEPISISERTGVTTDVAP
jgi:branched-chain amino acid transport system permease protein